MSSNLQLGVLGLGSIISFIVFFSILRPIFTKLNSIISYPVIRNLFFVFFVIVSLLCIKEFYFIISSTIEAGKVIEMSHFPNGFPQVKYLFINNRTETINESPAIFQYKVGEPIALRVFTPPWSKETWSVESSVFVVGLNCMLFLSLSFVFLLIPISCDSSKKKYPPTFSRKGTLKNILKIFILTLIFPLIVGCEVSEKPISMDQMGHFNKQYPVDDDWSIAFGELESGDITHLLIYPATSAFRITKREGVSIQINSEFKEVKVLKGTVVLASKDQVFVKPISLDRDILDSWIDAYKRDTVKINPLEHLSKYALSHQP